MNDSENNMQELNSWSSVGTFSSDDEQSGDVAGENVVVFETQPDESIESSLSDQSDSSSLETSQFDELDLEQLKLNILHLMANPILLEQCKSEPIFQDFITALQSDSLRRTPVGVDNSRSQQQEEEANNDETAPMNVEPQQQVVNNNAPPPVYPSLPVEPQQQETNNNNAAQVFGRQQDYALCLELVNRQHQQCIHLHQRDVVVADTHPERTIGTKEVWNKNKEEDGARSISFWQQRQAGRDLEMSKVLDNYRHVLQRVKPELYDEHDIIFWKKIKGDPPPQYVGFVARVRKTDDSGWIYYIKADIASINTNIRSLRGVV